ncbi:uncharacterized [Tachysurus ichikawai]
MLAVQIPSRRLCNAETATVYRMLSYLSVFLYTLIDDLTHQGSLGLYSNFSTSPFSVTMTTPNLRLGEVETRRKDGAKE